jgi:protein TonB
MEAKTGTDTDSETADAVAPADDGIALSERLVPPLDQNQRAFRLALVVALLVHASVFIEIVRSVPRAVGDRSGAADAIAVDLVTEADLKSRETVSMPAAGAPVPPPAATPQPETPKPEPEPQPEAAQPAPKEPPPQETAAEAKPEQKAALPEFATVLQDLPTTPLPSEEEPKEPQKPQEQKAEPPEPAKPVEKKEAPPTKKKAQQQARLEPTPRDLSTAPPGRSAAASRPPGITRSGENDEFGRAVVRALRQTMPPPRGIFGRVTVRLILSMNGDLDRVEVLDPSGTSLDQSVVFATKQTYFPLPPYNATSVDRTFIITYVYR